jgi:hypothetical protein
VIIHIPSAVADPAACLPFTFRQAMRHLHPAHIAPFEGRMDTGANIAQSISEF